MIRSTLSRAKCPHCGGDIMTAETNIYNSEPVHRCYCGGDVVDGRCRRCGALLIDMSHFRGSDYEQTILKLCVGGHDVDLFGVMRRIEVEREIAPMLYAGSKPVMAMQYGDSVRIHMLMDSVYVKE